MKLRISKNKIYLWLLVMNIVISFSFSIKVYAEDINVIPKRVKLENTFDRENLGNTISSGSSSSSIWITEDNRVKIYNSSNTDGEWGQGHSENIKSSEHPDGLFVKSPDGKSDLSGIVQVSTRGLRSTALDHEGNVYIWGGNVAGAAGKSSDTDHLNLPNKIKISGEEIYKVLQGNTKTIVLTEAGNMYITGHQAYNDRGDWSSNSSSSKFEKVKFPHGKIYKGFNHIRATFLITTDGEVYFTGKVPSSYDKKGGPQIIKDSWSAAKEWIKITPPGKKVVDGALSGENTFYMLTEEGELWMHGLLATSITGNKAGFNVIEKYNLEVLEKNDDNEDEYKKQRVYIPQSVSLTKEAKLPTNVKEIAGTSFGLTVLTEDGKCFTTNGDSVKKIAEDTFITRLGETFPASASVDVITSTGEKATLTRTTISKPEEIPGRTSVLTLQKAENTLKSEDIKEAEGVIKIMKDNYLKKELLSRLEDLKKNAPKINKMREDIEGLDVIKGDLTKLKKKHTELKAEYTTLNKEITNINIKESHSFTQISPNLQKIGKEIDKQISLDKQAEKLISDFNKYRIESKDSPTKIKDKCIKTEKEVKAIKIANIPAKTSKESTIKNIKDTVLLNEKACLSMDKAQETFSHVKKGKDIVNTKENLKMLEQLSEYSNRRKEFKNKNSILKYEAIVKDIRETTDKLEFKMDEKWVNENPQLKDYVIPNFLIKDYKLLDDKTSKYEIKYLNLLNEEKVIEYVLPFVDLKEPEIDIKKVETGGTPLS